LGWREESGVAEHEKLTMTMKDNEGRLEDVPVLAANTGIMTFRQFSFV